MQRESVSGRPRRGYFLFEGRARSVQRNGCVPRTCSAEHSPSHAAAACLLCSKRLAMGKVAWPVRGFTLHHHARACLLRCSTQPLLLPLTAAARQGLARTSASLRSRAASSGSEQRAPLRRLCAEHACRPAGCRVRSSLSRRACCSVHALRRRRCLSRCEAGQARSSGMRRQHAAPPHRTAPHRRAAAEAGGQHPSAARSMQQHPGGAAGGSHEPSLRRSPALSCLLHA